MSVGVASFTDTLKDKSYSEYNLDEIVELLNWYDNRLKEKDDLLKKTLTVNDNLSGDLLKLQEPNCRKCTHFSCDSASAYCMEKDWDWIDEMSDAKDCKHYECVL